MTDTDTMFDVITVYVTYKCKVMMIMIVFYTEIIVIITTIIMI